MANKNSIFGARVVKHLQSVHFTGGVTSYTVPATDSTALFVGDFVKLTGTAANGQDGKSYPVVTQAAATNTLVGFVDAFDADSNYLNQIYRTASTLRTAFVYDDPYVMFEIQATATVTATSIGLNADITVGAGDVITGLSGMQLDSTTATSATAQLRIMGISLREDNDYGEYAKLICMINEHAYKGTVGV
jgi:hypothetical protein